MTSLTKDLGHKTTGSPNKIVTPKVSELQKTVRYVRENSILFLIGAPAVILIFLFSYIPMMGTMIAFQDYSPRTMFLSPWVGFRNFRLLVESPIAVRLIVNTIQLNAMFIVATTSFSVISALLLNEVRALSFKRIAQSIMFLPFFMGWTIVAMVLFGLIDYQVGTINAIITKFGLARVIVTDKPDLWPWILTTIRVWKGTGAGCIIYLAALVSIDPQLYEAAAIDGASRWQRMRYVSLPSLTPVIILLVLLDIGRIFFGDFGMIYAVVGDKANLYATTDVIDTYLLRALRNNSNYGFSAAVGLLQSVLGFICIYGSNLLVKKYSQSRGEDYTLF
jgi:putative aldouronate transport system permease protein